MLRIIYRPRPFFGNAYGNATELCHLTFYNRQISLHRDKFVRNRTTKARVQKVLFYKNRVIFR